MRSHQPGVEERGSEPAGRNDEEDDHSQDDEAPSRHLLEMRVGYPSAEIRVTGKMCPEELVTWSEERGSEPAGRCNTRTEQRAAATATAKRGNRDTPITRGL